MKNYFFRIIICAMLLFIKVAYISAQENKANINNSQKDLKFSYINGFFISAIYDENKVHLVWDKYEPSTELSQVFIEKSSDGVNWKLLAVESIDNLIDIHIYNYPSYIQYENNLLYSTEVGYGRFIYNDVCDREELDNPFLRYRAGFITYDGKYLYTSEIEANSNINLEGIRIAEDNEINYNYSEETKQKQKPPIFTTKTVCPSVGSPPSGSTNTGQQQVYYGTCCTWTETLYTLPTTFQIVCGGSSYAWCCNNVTGVSGCTSGYWWDPCCVHTCSQFNSCSCHPWDCCNMIPGQNIWVVTSSTPFSGFQVNSQVINETCPNSSDGSVVLTPVGGTAPFNYTWSTGQTSNSLYFLTAGTYSCTVTDFYGCTVPVTINITSNPNPIANAG
ncbi:MAG TPA: SprB repeat-containing protein, partial [Bacteroidales bacterium]|nr:SprB repeat-containing protein [Bacteroidales bacterium]